MSRPMDMEQLVAQAIADELRRQADLSEGRLAVRAGPDGQLTVEGGVSLEELAMAVVGKVAGGP